MIQRLLNFSEMISLVEGFNLTFSDEVITLLRLFGDEQVRVGPYTDVPV
jgi:hypothetical protein